MVPVGGDGWVTAAGDCCCGERVVVGALGAVSGRTVGFSFGYLVGESDDNDGVDGGVIMSVGVGAVATTGAGVLGAVVVVVTMGEIGRAHV